MEEIYIKSSHTSGPGYLKPQFPLCDSDIPTEAWTPVTKESFHLGALLPVCLIVYWTWKSHSDTPCLFCHGWPKPMRQVGKIGDWNVPQKHVALWLFVSEWPSVWSGLLIPISFFPQVLLGGEQLMGTSTFSTGAHQLLTPRQTFTLMPRDQQVPILYILQLHIWINSLSLTLGADCTT